MKKIIAALVLAQGISFGANATIATVFNSIPDGVVDFNNTVSLAGGTALSETLQYGVTSYADFSVSKVPYSNYGYMSGATMGIDPYGSGSDPMNYQASGVTFTFNTSINSFGLEVGDWGTCCQPSALYISFDGGSAIKVGQSDVYGDVFYDNLAEVFVAAFDDSGSFSTISFWGDGVGEYLVAGGTIRYALLDEGTLPPTPGVPEPATWLMMIMGFGLMGVASRRRLRDRHEQVSAA